MITTAVGMYELLLELYQRQKTGSLTVDEFNQRVNVAALNLIKSKLPAAESSQEIDDALRTLMRDRIIVANVGSGSLVNMVSEIEANNLQNPHPYYLRMLGVRFKLQYKGNKCFEDGTISDWITARKYRIDNAIADKDPFRGPSDERPFYRLISSDTADYIEPITRTPSIISEIKLTYIKYPSFIYLDPNNVAHQDSDLPSEIQQEIVYVMLRELLENTESPRVYKPAESGAN